jgi:hypothetical protein
VTYSSSDKKVAKINSKTGKITYVGAGTTTITVNAAETSNYKKASTTVKLTVKAASQTISLGKKVKATTTYTASAKTGTLSKKKTLTLGAKTSGNGKLTYAVTKTPSKASKYISVSKTGKVTLKKGAKKGTYKITISAAKTSQYKTAKKVVTIKVISRNRVF